MTLTFKDDHVGEGLDLLLGQFKEKANIEATLTAFLDQVQDLEDLNSSLVTDRLIENAVGEQLNILGRIVGQPREGREDDVYRLWIIARIAINKSSGTAEEIYTILKLLTGEMESGSFQIIDAYMAGFELYSYVVLTAEQAAIVVDILNEMKPICVSFTFTYGTTDPVALFDDATTPFDTGTFAAVIES